MNAKQNMIIVREVAIECSIVTSDELKIKLNFNGIVGLSNKYYTWMYSKGSAVNVLIDRQATLKRTVMALKVLKNEVKPKTSDEVLELADKFYKYIIN